ncbi:MAG: alanine--tRNA ligase-related protein [Candidatus Micrarchaeota archaeon]
MKRIYLDDPYMQDFTADIREIEEKEGLHHIRLDSTTFYPGGGGQACDTGKIKGKDAVGEVESTYEKDGAVWHVCSVSGSFLLGETITGKIDWKRRYSLMKSHTAEHILFHSLMGVCKGIEMIKVNLVPEGSSILVRYPSNINMGLALSAEKIANNVISKNIPVTVKTFGKDNLPEGTRVKLERIHQDDVKVVQIGDFDKCACTGLHVKNTGEISLLTITNITNEGTNQHKISFLVGEQAQEYLLETKKACDGACAILQTTSDKLEKTMTNLKEQKEKLESMVISLNDRILDEIEPANFGEYNLYSKVFVDMDDKKLMEKAGKLIETGRTIVLFGNKKGDDAFILIAKSPDSDINIESISAKMFPLMDGKGGGKGNFLSGAGKADKLGEAFGFAEEEIVEKLVN